MQITHLHSASTHTRIPRSTCLPQVLGKLLKYVNERKHVVKIAATKALATALHADQKDEEEVMKVVASECPTIVAALKTLLPRLRRAIGSAGSTQHLPK